MDRVLVVDDEPGIRGLMAHWSESFGCLVSSVTSAEQAIDALARTPCAVAVCDVRLPGHDGLWLAREVRDRFPEVAVVIATETRGLDTVVGGLRSGVVDYLVKPFGRERFREAIARGREWHRTAAEAGQQDRSGSLELASRRRRLADALRALDLSSDEAVRAAVAILTLRERPMLDHVTRVASLAGRLAASLELPASDAADVERAAIVHEVPRSLVPETILWKAGELTASDWAILRAQPEMGYGLFCGQPLLARASLIVRAMRERYDGTGYPRALAGEAIPIGARILAAADAFDTMTRPLVLRDPLPPSDAASELVAGCGTQFDPAVVAALLQLLDYPAPARAPR